MPMLRPCIFCLFRFRFSCVNIIHVNNTQPTLIPRSAHTLSRKWISPNALRVLYRLKEAGYLAYLVGGGVRDLLLGREPKDFDIATDATPGEVKKLFRNCRLIGRRFRLAHIYFHNEIIEVATFRAQIAATADAAQEATTAEFPHGSSSASAPACAAGGSSIQTADSQANQPQQKPVPPRVLKTEEGMILRDNEFGSPEEDALRRDFTVNALFYNIADFSVIDYVNGMGDLQSGAIRVIGDPVVRFTEDPVRMVRAVRFAAMLGFDIEETTYHAIARLKEKVSLASPARMYEEVLKLFLLGEGEKTYQLLRKTGLFGVIFPLLNEWVDAESNSFPHTWIGKVLDWVDAAVQSGKPVSTTLLFALLFGQCIAEKSAELREDGLARLDAVTKAVHEVLAVQAPRVQIPKKIGLAMRDIYWNQQRFAKREGKYPHYFLHRPGFGDAYEYLCFTSEALGEHKDLCAWWKTFALTNPPAIAPNEHKKKQAQAGKTSSARRRKRPRKQHGAQKQKSVKTLPEKNARPASIAGTHIEDTYRNPKRSSDAPETARAPEQGH